MKFQDESYLIPEYHGCKISGSKILKKAGVLLSPDRREK